jgi:methylenetetrahydrofolate dehydrogenase (NADP+)/methenyltetrahydrofolate cyclohydrolase
VIAAINQESKGFQLIDGRQSAEKLKAFISDAVQQLRQRYHIVPGLAIIRIGDHKPSQVYVASKQRQCEEVGILSFEHHLPEHVKPEVVLDLLHRLNVDSAIHGIIIQLPLPRHLDASKIIMAIDPLKDVDGLHPINLGRLAMGSPGFVPCTPLGCLELLKTQFKSLSGLHAVVIGRSNLVGKPLMLLLMQQDCTVSVVHSKTRKPESITSQADILVVAVGKPRLVKRTWVKPGAVVIDVGINHLLDKEGNSYLVGDVDFDDVKSIVKAITPVPGGVGPMTVSLLLLNTLKAAEQQAKLASQQSE